MPEPVGDATMGALHYALNGLSLRQRTIADNTANIETPGFLAGKVNFEDALRNSVENDTDPFGTGPSTARSLEPTRLNGNNVNLDEETLAGSETNLTYGLAVQAMTAKFQLLRIAAGGNP
ncbi:MAG: flagellar basal-body rod protein FlgB [Actinomycetota bacterium]|jgi:flagellar basal-body rod protein FlgB|nr:flagellar basal-body rod protein FlgB [Actinomycetota bacterium]